MTAYLIVRAEVPEADRAAFDRWYEDEHLPDAKAAFGAVSAMRGWVDEDPGLHVAFYAFPDAAAARGIVGSDAIRGLIAEFDRIWQGRVARKREVVGISQAI